MRQWLTFGGSDTRDYGVYISGSGVYDAPVRVYEEITVPGRNGILLGSEKRLESVELTYPAFIYRDFAKNIQNFKGMLYSKSGFQELVDTYNPDEYRMAMFAGGLEIEMDPVLSGGHFDLTFICRPERFLFLGTVPLMSTSDQMVTYNPTEFDARPLIRVYGTGSLTVNGTTITITEASEYTDIDCDLMEVFKGDYSRNAYVEIDGNEFPVLSPGDNVITRASSAISKIEITPRWWRL